MIIHSCTSYRQSSDNAKLVQASTHRVVGVLMVINKGKCVCVCVCVRAWVCVRVQISPLMCGVPGMMLPHSWIKGRMPHHPSFYMCIL